MKRVNDATMNKVRDEIARLEREIELDKVRLLTLRDLLPNDVKEDPKPKGFVLTTAIKEVLSSQPGEYLTQEEIFMRIAAKWDGYQPNKKSLDITLGVWVKGGRLGKEVTPSGKPGYKWI